MGNGEGEQGSELDGGGVTSASKPHNAQNRGPAIRFNNTQALEVLRYMFERMRSLTPESWTASHL